MKTLWIGDVHLRLSDLQDSDSLIDQLLDIIVQEAPETTILAGDLFDTFGIVRSEILAKWTRFFLEASKITKTVALVGNHDMAGADGGVSSMEPFKAYPNVTIVDRPTYIPGLAFFYPFIRDTKHFEAQCRALPDGALLFCHQSFNGAQFENGFYDPHGADVSCVEHLGGAISGHVHKAQKIANIEYLGTPRQLTFSDSGEKKAVFTLTLSKDSYTVDKSHVLDLPTFEVIETDTLEELVAKIAKVTPSTRTHYKFIAKGSPSNIANFWEIPEVQDFKSKAKRVVDALTSMKPATAFVTVKGQTQDEKLSEYIKQRAWRTDADQLARRARECLIN